MRASTNDLYYCLLAIFSISATNALAVDIAGQNFDALAAATIEGASLNFTDVTLDSSLGEQALTHAGAFNDRTDAGLQFSTTWFATRFTDGMEEGSPDLGGDNLVDGPKTTNTINFVESGDFIGVNGFAGTNSPDVDPDGNTVLGDIADGIGKHNYEFNDAEGTQRLTFEAVDISSFSGVGFSFYYWIAATGFESEDSFKVYLKDEFDNTQVLLDLGELELEGANPLGDSGSADEWNLSSTAISLPGTMITAIFEGDQDSGSENMFIDSVLFSDGFVNEFNPGDFNKDGKVDAADYAVWRNGLVTEEYTLADYDVWRMNYGAGTGGEPAIATPAPEPAALAGLLSLMTLAIVSRKR